AIDDAGGGARHRHLDVGAPQHVDDRDRLDLLEAIRKEEQHLRTAFDHVPDSCSRRDLSFVASNSFASYGSTRRKQSSARCLKLRRVLQALWTSCVQGRRRNARTFFSTRRRLPTRPIRGTTPRRFAAGRGARDGGRSSARVFPERSMRVRPSGSFRRYLVDPRGIAGGVTKLREDGAALEKQFHSQRFRSIDQAASAVSSVGWSRGDGTVPARFDADELWLANYLVAALRIDKKQLPSGALRVRRMEAEALERKNVGERIVLFSDSATTEKIESELVTRMVPST